MAGFQTEALLIYGFRFVIEPWAAQKTCFNHSWYRELIARKISESL